MEPAKTTQPTPHAHVFDEQALPCHGEKYEALIVYSITKYILFLA